MLNLLISSCNMKRRIDFTANEIKDIVSNITKLSNQYFGEGNYTLFKVDDPNAPRYKIVPKLFDCNGKFALRLKCGNLVRFSGVEFLLNKHNDQPKYSMRMQVCGAFKGYRKKNCEMYRTIEVENERQLYSVQFVNSIPDLFGDNIRFILDKTMLELKTAKPTKIEIDYWK